MIKRGRAAIEAAQRAMDSKGACSFCDSRNWIGGPRGGSCQNVSCGTCGETLNILSMADIPPRVINVLAPDRSKRAVYETNLRRRPWRLRVAAVIARTMRRFQSRLGAL